MDIVSLVLSVVAISFCVFNLLVLLGMVRITKQRDFKQYFRDSPDALMNREQNAPLKPKSVYRGT